MDVFARRVDLPWSRFDNLYNRFTLLPKLGSDRYLIEADPVLSKGVEVAASYGTQTMNWKLVHVWLDSRERVAGIWHERSWDQQGSLKAQVVWSRKNWSVGCNLIYRSGWPITLLITNPEQLPRLLSKDRLPDFLSLDLHFARSTQRRSGILEIYGDITNATNRLNLTGYLYDSEFSRKHLRSLPTVPAIGVRWYW
ncbi:MAG: hypothetical protein OXG05_14300 [Gammaproteobacteria bacterium]|nr:hypothetical protein [Gammaproteobacteria bacterium]